MIARIQSKIKRIFKSIPIFRTPPEKKEHISKEQEKQNLLREKESEIQNLINSGLPEQIKSCLCFLVKETSDKDIEAVTQQVEQRRAEIASSGITLKTRKRTIEQIALNVSKNRRWGTALYLLARDFKVTTVLELGSCVGISASYLSHAPCVNKLITIEGSEELAGIAEESLACFKGKSKVINGLFNDVIDNELPKLDRKIDLAYIDGHHEKNATIHYFNRLLPYLAEKAMVIFDDISWSSDMREAWDILRKREEFSHAMDLGVLGICILKDKSFAKIAPDNWDLQPIIGKRRIGTACYTGPSLSKA